MALLKKEWLPNCSMKKVICHWTAANHRASPLDKVHYHFLIEKDGKVVRGAQSIEDNVSTKDGVYAAHTLNCNTGSIGVAVCCMLGAVERPFSPGPAPMLEVQWQTLAEVVAELCMFYRIPVTPRTVLGHGEVEPNLGIPQKGKWDPMVLPWNPTMSRTQVGTLFRSLVQNATERGPELEETLASVEVVLRGTRITDAFIANENAFARSSAVASALGGSIEQEDEDEVVLKMGEALHNLPAMASKGKSYAGCRELVRALGEKGSWDPVKRVVTIGTA